MGEINNERAPQVDSKDPEERKLARRLRIERRREAIKKQDVPETEEIEKQEEPKTLFQSQIKKSGEVLENFIIDGAEYISNVRIASESREVDRREQEGRKRDEILDQLDAEAESAKTLFDEITSKWAVIRNYNDPLNINDDMMNQKDKCELLLQHKEEIIAMLREEISKAERTFTRDQRRQMEDINTLAQRIEKQITFMRKTIKQELELIEEVVLTERKRLIETSDKKWEELYNKQEQEEITNSDKKFEQLEYFENKMTDLRMNFEELYRETKIKLENDIEELEREMERIKALALINSEKLDYNYQLLKKREDENIIIKSQQKRRMNKLQDVINVCKKKISDYEAFTNNQVKKLMEDIKKLHNRILEIEAKADHFATVNNEKFEKIWDMNTKSVQTILKEILDTDKILYEQQMGIDWEPSGVHTIDKKQLPSYRNARRLMKLKASENGPGISLEDIRDSQFEYDMELERNSIHKRVVKHLLTKISDKTGFLSEKRLRTILGQYHDYQRTLVRLDNIFQALGISDRSYIGALIVFFYPYTYCPECQGSTRPQSVKSDTRSSQVSTMSSVLNRTQTFKPPDLENVIGAVRHTDDLIEDIVLQLVKEEDFFEDENVSSESHIEIHEDIDAICGDIGEEIHKERAATKASKDAKQPMPSEFFTCQYHHPLILSSIYVSRALKEFVVAYYGSYKMGVPTTNSRLLNVRYTVSRLMSDEDIVDYWERFQKVFCEDRVRVWDALLEGLKKYQEILKDRKVLSIDVSKLRRENEELKRLLANYLDHKEFMTPPCANQRENFLTATPPIYTNKK